MDPVTLGSCPLHLVDLRFPASTIAEVSVLTSICDWVHCRVYDMYSLHRGGLLKGFLKNAKGHRSTHSGPLLGCHSS